MSTSDISHNQFPEHVTMTDKLRNAYEDLTFLTSPSYEEVRFKDVPINDGLESAMKVKLIKEDGQLAGHIVVANGFGAETFTKMDNHDQWMHTGSKSDMLSSYDMLGYVQNLLGTPITEASFNYLNGDSRVLDDDTMLRGTVDTLAAKSEAAEYIHAYTHERIDITSGGELIPQEGVTLGQVVATSPDGSPDTFWFATLDMQHNIQPEYVQYGQAEATDYGIMPGSEVTITCRVEVRENADPTYCAYVHDQETGLLKEIGVPNGEQVMRPLIEEAINDYLNTL